MASGNVLTDTGGRHAPSQAGDVHTLRGKLVVNQGGADDEILHLKSSDVAHGMTSIAETDSYAIAEKVAADGGLILRGLSGAGSSTALIAQGLSGVAADATKSNAGRGVTRIAGAVKNGVGVQNIAAGGNLLSVDNNGTTRFILDGDGNSYQDVGTAWTNFDIFDDLEVLNALAAHVTRRDDPLRESFRAWLAQPEYRRVLEKYHLVTFNDGPDGDGSIFVNMSRLTMLLCGAVRQMGQALEGMALGMQQLSRRMRAIETAT